MATKSTRKSTITATPFVETQEPSFDFNAMMDSLPSWQRIACAWVASLVTSVGIGYLGGYITSYLMLGAALLTGSVFITLLVYVLGMLLTIYAGYKAGLFVHLEVITEKVDARIESAKSYVSGLFSSQKVCAS